MLAQPSDMEHRLAFREVHNRLGEPAADIAVDRDLLCGIGEAVGVLLQLALFVAAQCLQTAERRFEHLAADAVLLFIYAQRGVAVGPED